MRAVWYERPGAAAEVLTYGELPDPAPGDGEVRVRVAFSAVNPTDVKRRSSGRELDRFRRIVPHNDGSGVIDRVGTDVPESRVGERVWIFGAQAMRPSGTAAGYVVLPARQAIALPATVSLEQGACLGVPAVTAHRCLFSDGPIAGRTVLVSGGAGRVGQCAVQLAKWANATVLATVGSAAKGEHVRALGADCVLNYRSDDVVAAARELGGMDRIVEVAFGANIAAAPRLLKPNGVIAAYASDAVERPELPFHALMYNNTTLRLIAIFGMPREAQDKAFADVTDCLRQGRLQVAAGKRFDYEEIVQAHEALEGGTVTGCVLVTVDPALAAS